MSLESAKFALTGATEEPRSVAKGYNLPRDAISLLIVTAGILQ